MSTEILVLNMKGQEVSKRKLSEKVFSLTPRKDILHFLVVNHLANCRQGTQSTLTRSEVRGGGRKPWRQKGTGLLWGQNQENMVFRLTKRLENLL